VQATPSTAAAPAAASKADLVSLIGASDLDLKDVISACAAACTRRFVSEVMSGTSPGAAGSNDFSTVHFEGAIISSAIEKRIVAEFRSLHQWIDEGAGTQPPATLTAPATKQPSLLHQQHPTGTVRDVWADTRSASASSGEHDKEPTCLADRTTQPAPAAVMRAANLSLLRNPMETIVPDSFIPRRNPTQTSISPVPAKRFSVPRAKPQAFQATPPQWQERPLLPRSHSSGRSEGPVVALVRNSQSAEKKRQSSTGTGQRIDDGARMQSARLLSPTVPSPQRMRTNLAVPVRLSGGSLTPQTTGPASRFHAAMPMDRPAGQFTGARHQLGTREAEEPRSFSLPEGWVEYTASKGGIFYHHVASNTTQWEVPL
jgi:hypothetical protein